jgi:DNA-binding MarR family transcriptional regulator
MDKPRTLNTGQLTLLSLIAKYRFVAVKQLSSSLGINISALHEKLDILIKKGYVIKRYNPSYKFQARPAAFCLTPRSLKLLQELGEAKYITTVLIKASYKDKTQTGEQTMDDCFTVFNIAQSLERSYPGVKLYTARQLAILEYLPKQLPDLYVVLGEGEHISRYFLIRFPLHKPNSSAVGQIKKLVEYAEDDNWNITGHAFPTILAVCDSTRIERLVQRTFQWAIGQSSEFLEVYTTSTKAASQLSKENMAIWTDIDDIDELREL